MGVTRLLLLWLFYTIQMQIYVLFCTRLYLFNFDYWETWLKLVMLENLQACFFDCLQELWINYYNQTIYCLYFRSFNQRSVPGSVMFFNQCRKFQTFLWSRRYSQSQIDPCRWGIGITGQLTGFVPVCRTWWRPWAFTWWWGQEKTCSSWYPQVSVTCMSSRFFFSYLLI